MTIRFFYLTCLWIIKHFFPSFSLLLSLPQTVNQRVWRLTRSRQHSSLTPHWQRLDAGSSHTTFFSQRRSWRCGKRTLRASVIAYPQIHSLNLNVQTYLDLQTGRVNSIPEQRGLASFTVHEVSNVTLGPGFIRIYCLVKLCRDVVLDSCSKVKLWAHYNSPNNDFLLCDNLHKNCFHRT